MANEMLIKIIVKFVPMGKRRKGKPKRNCHEIAQTAKRTNQSQVFQRMNGNEWHLGTVKRASVVVNRIQSVCNLQTKHCTSIVKTNCHRFVSMQCRNQCADD
jgi:hypothetical protein